MTSRREFLGKASALAGVCFTGCGLLGAREARAQGRRMVSVAGKRTKVIDVHAHVVMPEALEIAGLKPGTSSATRRDLVLPATLEQRLALMDSQGIDMEVLSVNPYWYAMDRDRAARICEIQNEKLAELCASNPDRFSAFASVALQFPDLAAEQLQQGLKKYGLRGAAIGGSVAGLELSNEKLHPFWAKVESLGVPVFIHPQVEGATRDLGKRLGGNGHLGNAIGYPAETTIALSHLIFDGTLDRFPALKIIAAHGGGFLPSYAGRFDAACPSRPVACAGGTYGNIKKKPSEYLRQLYYDTMLFTGEGLRHLAAEVGASQLVLGTDTPFPWTKTAVDHVLTTPELSDADKAAILEGNAARLLNL